MHDTARRVTGDNGVPANGTATLEDFAREIAPKLIADARIQAAALDGPDAYEAALEIELPRILEAHRVSMQKAFITLELLVAHPYSARAVRQFFTPRIYAAVHGTGPRGLVNREPHDSRNTTNKENES